MSMPLALFVLAAVGATVAATPAAAQKSSPFDHTDVNGDGKISREEYMTARSAQFDKLDRNHDGVINQSDFPKAQNHRRALKRLDAQISDADANGDGSVSREELSGASTPLFDRADTNKDNVIDQNEAEAARKAVAARRK